MTDRTCLDVAADEIRNNIDGEWICLEHLAARAALDAIHPALAHLTPDDVAAIFGFFVSSTSLAASEYGTTVVDVRRELVRLREVLSR